MTALPADLQAILSAVHDAATRKLAKDCVALDVRALSSFTDLLYICHGSSERAVDAIAGEILGALSAGQHRGFHTEGRAGQQWVLIDGGTVMIHVFLEEKRHYYDLERLWHDAPKVPLAA